MRNKGQTLLFLGFILVSISTTASPFGNFGGSKGWGGNSWGDCNDWPEWTPMYWMEKMFGNDTDCDDFRYRYSNHPYNLYQNPYSAYSPYTPYQVPYNPYSMYQNPYRANPYASLYFGDAGGYGRYGSRYARGYSYNNPYALPYVGGTGRGYRGYANPYAVRGLRHAYGRGFPSVPGYTGFNRGFSPFGGGYGGLPGVSSFGSGFSPLGGGFGMPMSGMGMSPMGFGSPFSGSGMNPFSSGMRSPFAF